MVVDVTNHNAKVWFDQAAHFYTDTVHIVERFTLADRNTIHYQVTIDDPSVDTRPWAMAFPLRRNIESGFRLLEEACHEGAQFRLARSPWLQDLPRYEDGWAMTRATLRSV